MTKPETLRRTWFLTAGETDARGLMPVTLMAARAIETATLHANALGIGYANLAEHRLGWVLARITVEVLRYPAINETYSMETWIEGYNKFFSDRCFVLEDEAGQPVAHIRSVWVAIDTERRTLANLSELERDCFPTADRVCGVPKTPRPAPVAGAPVTEAEYTWRYRDIDFNRHVNTVRYMDAVLNLRPMDFYDSHDIVRLDASFDHECLFGQTAVLRTGPARSGGEITEIIAPDGRRAVGIDLTFKKLDNC